MWLAQSQLNGFRSEAGPIKKEPISSMPRDPTIVLSMRANRPTRVREWGPEFGALRVHPGSPVSAALAPSRLGGRQGLVSPFLRFRT